MSWDNFSEEPENEMGQGGQGQQPIPNEPKKLIDSVKTLDSLSSVKAIDKNVLVWAFFINTPLI